MTYFNNKLNQILENRFDQRTADALRKKALEDKANIGFYADYLEEFGDPRAMDYRKLGFIPQWTPSTGSWDDEITTGMDLDNTALLGDDFYYVEFTLGVDISPGEPAVMYYPDGSGYPGSPDDFHWEVIKIENVEIYNEDGTDTMPVEPDEELTARIVHALYKEIDDDFVAELLW